MASTRPGKVGETLSLIGVKQWTNRIDSKRGVPRGDTEAMLARVTQRRNMIAHTADRVGRGRAQLTVAEVRADLDALKSFVTAVEAIVL